MAIRKYRTKISLDRLMVKFMRERLKWGKYQKKEEIDTEKELLKTKTIYVPSAPIQVLSGTMQKSAFSI